MDEDVLNLSIRKFLKKVGINSQREIEKTIRDALADGSLKDEDVVNVSMTLRIGDQGSEMIIDDQIKLE